jgi:hypothetical protein
MPEPPVKGSSQSTITSEPEVVRVGASGAEGRSIAVMVTAGLRSPEPWMLIARYLNWYSWPLDRDETVTEVELVVT